MEVIKHDGRREPFDGTKIIKAVMKAANECFGIAESTNIGKETAEVISEGISFDTTVDEIHNRVEKYLMQYYPDVAKRYILYRQERTDYRESNSKLNKEIDKIEKEMHHDNANTGNCAASKMYGIAGLVEKQHNLARMNPVHARNHKLGRLYVHDLDYFSLTVNCFFSPLGEMLKNGFDNGVGTLRSPKHIGTAVQLACIILQSSQNDFFGGQGFVHFCRDLAPYVEMEYENQLKSISAEMQEVAGDISIVTHKSAIEKLAMKRTEKEVHQAMEAFVANMNTMRSRSGQTLSAIVMSAA